MMLRFSLLRLEIGPTPTDFIPGGLIDGDVPESNGERKEREREKESEKPRTRICPSVLFVNPPRPVFVYYRIRRSPHCGSGNSV